MAAMQHRLDAMEIDDDGADADPPDQFWCRYCGAKKTARKRRGPRSWGNGGKHMLCNVCGIKYAKSTLAIALPMSEPVGPIDPTKNTEYKYECIMEAKGGRGGKKKSFEQQMAQRAHLRHLVYEVFGATNPVADKAECETLMKLQMPHNVIAMQHDIFNMHDVFDGTRRADWVRLDQLVVKRDLLVRENDAFILNVGNKLSRQRKELAVIHRTYATLLARINAATPDCDDAAWSAPACPAAVNGLSNSEGLVTAARASEESDAMLRRVSPKLDEELRTLHAALAEQKRKLPRYYEDQMSTCRVLRTLLSSRLATLKKEALRHVTCDPGAHPEERIYKHFLRERLRDFPAELHWFDMDTVSRWRDKGVFAKAHARVTIDEDDGVHRSLTAHAYTNGALALSHALFLSRCLPSSARTFFAPLRRVTAIGAHIVLLTEYDNCVSMDQSGLALGDFIRQLMAMFDVSACIARVPTCYRVVTYEQLSVSRNHVVKVHPVTSDTQRDKERRAHYLWKGSQNDCVYNIGALLHQHVHGCLPYAMPANPMLGEHGGLLRRMLTETRRPSLRALMCSPQLLCPETAQHLRLINDNVLHAAKVDAEIALDRFQMRSHFDEKAQPMVVERGTVMNDIMSFMIGSREDLSEEWYYTNLSVRFDKEEGAGAGVTSDAWTKLFEEMFRHAMWDRGESGRVLPTEHGHQRACSECGDGDQPCKWLSVPAFRAAGKILAIMLSRREKVNIPLSFVATRYLMGGVLQVSDTLDFDRDIVKTHRRYEAEPDIAVHGLTFGSLLPEEKGVLVTNERRQHFLQLKLQDEVWSKREPWFMALKEGFRSFSYVRDTLKHMSARGLHEQLFRSYATCTPQAILDSLCFVAQSRADTATKCVLRDTIRAFDETRCRDFLSFVTGVTVLPPDVEKHTYIQVHIDTRQGRLPVARSCFNQLFLATYPPGAKSTAKLTRDFETIFDTPGMRAFTFR